VSLLLLFLRIFKTTIKKVVYVGFVVVVAYGIYLVLTMIFFCVPVAAFWDLSITKATCFAKSPKWFIDAGLNIATDVGILIIPIPVLRTLSLPRKQKYGLYIVFALGFLYVLDFPLPLPCSAHHENL
jgi:rhodopsin domain-containing protein